MLFYNISINKCCEIFTKNIYYLMNNQCTKKQCFKGVNILIIILYAVLSMPLCNFRDNCNSVIDFSHDIYLVFKFCIYCCIITILYITFYWNKCPVVYTVQFSILYLLEIMLCHLLYICHFLLWL